MNNLVQLIASCFVNSLWEVAVIGAVGWMVSRLFGRVGPRLHHVWWVGTLGLAAITPAVPLLRLLFAPSALPVGPQSSVGISVFDPQAVSSSFLLPPTSVLVLFLFFVCAFMWSAARLGWSLRSTIRLRREACSTSLGSEVEEPWDHCKRVFSLTRGQILRSGGVVGPATIGFIRPVLLVSDRFVRECRSQDILATLAHECAHIKRRDFQKNLLYEFVSLGIAYHPATWFVKSQIARTREMICDELAAEKLMDRRSYAESLLRLASLISGTVGAMTRNAIGILDANVLEERIMTMKTERKYVGATLKYGAAAVSVLILLSVAAAVSAVARPIKAQSQDGSSTSRLTLHGQSDLACTYYDGARGVDGTCETHKGDKTHYFCSPNFDRKVSQEQIGCKEKIQYAKSHKAKRVDK
ncbi:MAG TPA: M56 family metallopeptidase [Candidatus Acidoferrum sp.]|nr:M56 family metallopeptidase [Candidatus Acidoferrum sp.]